MSDPVIFRGRMYASAMEALQDIAPHLRIAEPIFPVRSWFEVVDHLELGSTEEWWRGGVYDDSWQARLERRARQIKAQTRSEAWYANRRIDLEFEELRADLGLRRPLPATVLL
ncbi:MAG: hypothetical protein AB7I42_25980 [Bradyrhizobium sp.]|uniref:hypothetical protein n=1 Tax=Bradyrhizobium sp. TaxID=376 RepID=UPI003D136FF5